MMAVYFIRNSYTGSIKVGYTSRSVESRLAALQGSNSSELVIHAVIPHGTMALERELHSRLSEYRVRGEWFNIPEDVLDDVVKAEIGWMDRIPAGFVLTRRGLILERDVKEDDCSPKPEEVAICKQWFESCVSDARDNNYQYSSYHWKHVVERWTRSNGKEIYVPNGAFIQAAMELGYKCVFRDAKYNSAPNIDVVLALREDDWRRVRPTGFTKWLLDHVDDDTILGDLARDVIADPTWNRHCTPHEALDEFRSEHGWWGIRDVVLKALWEYRLEARQK